MSESGQHKKLVELIIQEITRIVGNDLACLIETDLADNRPIPPLTSEGFRPDVMFQYNGVMIIGEAKSQTDVDRMHSIKQYESYIKKCSLCQNNATFMLSVPWTEAATAINITNRIKKKYPGDYSIKIIKGIGV